LGAEKTKEADLTADQFQSDCENCVGLCCVSLSFSRAEGQFGHDKMAGTPCQYLDAHHACRIHARREQLGYEGCVDFECLGAGQRATAYLRSDSQRPLGSGEIHARFALLLRLQEMRMALDAAASLDVDAALEARRRKLAGRISELADSQDDAIVGPSEASLLEAHAFLQQLAALDA
jgi:hypothetical protein